MPIDRTAAFSHLPVRQAVLKQILPAVASQMIALLYSLADTYFVGLLNAPAQTAAITVAYPSFLLLTAFANLFGVGGAALLAQKLGKQEVAAAKEISVLSFWGGCLAASVASLFFLLLSKQILALCGASGETLPFAQAYVKWTVIYGAFPTILSTILSHLIRAEGGAAQASFGLSLGGILNIFLDPFFILPSFLGYGAAGAGMATALSNGITCLYFLLYLRNGSSLLRLSPALLPQAKRHWSALLSVGFPSALQYALTVVAVAAQSAFVAKYATEAAAALGIVKKLDQLPLYVSIGISNGLLPLLAYLHGAGEETRRRETFRFGASLSLVFSLLCVILYEGFAPQLTALFIADPKTIAYGAAFLRRMVLAMPFMALCYPLIIQFQARGQVREALITSVLRKGVPDIPLLFLFDRLLPLYGCMWVQPVVDLVSLVVALRFTLPHKKGVSQNETN